VKGSPEVIKELVQPSSVPPDFDSVLAEYTREGLRVLALAQGAVLPGMLPEGGVLSLTQQQLEATVPLQLVGLAVLANPLRPDSAGAIQDLQNALVGCNCLRAVCCVSACTSTAAFEAAPAWVKAWPLCACLLLNCTIICCCACLPLPCRSGPPW
jgi:hypothetical protein